MQSKRILIVDDEPNVTAMLSEGLQKLGDEYIIETANSGPEAMSKIEQHTYEMLITDYMMPDIDGLELAQAVLQTSPQTQIVLMTAYGSPELRDAVEELEINCYLDKPFTVIQIRQTVECALGESAPPPRVLVMEDEDDLRRLYSKALSKSGYKVETAATIDEARALLAQYHFDAFVSDIHIGAERGTDLLSEQMDALKKSGTQIIMASADARYRSMAEEMGVDFYLEKPIAIGPLITLLDRLTARPG